MDENELKTAEPDAAEQADVQTEPSVTPEETSVPSEDTAAQENADAPETSEGAEAASGEPEENSENADEKQIDWIAEIVDILETMLISVFSILLIFAYLMRPVTVEGRSMVPTLYNHDKLVMFRLFYQPKVGDVVVINSQGGHVFSGDRVVDSGASLDECIIKRVIAVGGQKVDITSSDETTENGASALRVYVDDVLLDEPFINEEMWANDGAFEYPITIPEGYIFVMGDNRNHSSDSRSVYVGLVEEKDVMGTAYFRYQPAKDEETGQKFGTVGFIR